MTVAQMLGPQAERVRKWVRRAEIDGGSRPGTSSEEVKELRRLRRENAELRRSNDILKAASFFGAASIAALEYVDWFNNRRLQGQIIDGPGYTTPVEHENDHYRDSPAATKPETALTLECP